MVGRSDEREVVFMVHRSPVIRPVHEKIDGSGKHCSYTMLIPMAKLDNRESQECDGIEVGSTARVCLTYNWVDGP